MKITSNNSATNSHNLLGKPGAPKVAYIREHPTLESLTGTHAVKPGGVLGISQRLYNIRLVLSGEQRPTLVSEAKKDGYQYGALPSTTKFTRSSSKRTFPFQKQAEVASKLTISRPATVKNYQGTNPPTRFVPAGVMKVKKLSTTQEKMRFPDTNSMMKVHVSEQYETTLKNPASTELKPELTTPKHIGTVGSFELSDRYVIHRQLEPKSSTTKKIKQFFHFGSASKVAVAQAPKRTLLIQAHGIEPEADQIDSKTGDLIPKDFALPNDLALSHCAPSTKVVASITSFSSTEKYLTLSDVAKDMPIFSTQRMSGSTHVIEFAGPVIAREDITNDPNGVTIPVDASDLFKMATGLTPMAGHGRTSNQIFSPIEDIRPENLSSGTVNRNWSNSAQRGATTHDAVTFAAMEKNASGERVDVLTIKPGQEGSLADLLKQLNDKGIKYDRITSHACRERDEIDRVLNGTPFRIHDDGSNSTWPVANNVHPDANSGLPRVGPTIVKFDAANARPRIDTVSPNHLSQLKPAIAVENESNPIASLAVPNNPLEPTKPLEAQINSRAKNATTETNSTPSIVLPTTSNSAMDTKKLLIAPVETDVIGFLGADNITKELKDFLNSGQKS